MQLNDESTLALEKSYPPGSRVPVESPENVEMGGKIQSIRLCVAPAWKTVFRYLTYLCTAFIMYLFNLWIISLRISMSLSDSNLLKAKKVVIYGADKNTEVVDLIEERTSKQVLKVFTYRMFKYYYDPSAGCFKPCQFKIEKLTLNQIHETYGRGSDEKVVRDNKIFFGSNLTDIPRRSCFKLLFEEVLSPFYVFQIYSFIVWYLDEYWVYAAMICVFSIGSIGVTLYETMQTTNKLRAMSYYEIIVKVYRKIDGETVTMNLNSSELVPGDLIEIPENAAMPCDAILLNGSCIMNEAMLTGESIPVVKNSLPYNDVYYNPKEDKQYTLYAGTKCIQARYYQGNAVLGLVTLTGFSTVKGELIRTMLYPKPTEFKFYADSFKFIGILGGMAAVGFFIDLPSWIKNNDSGLLRVIIIKASEIVTVTVPPALPTCMQIGISVALSRLKKRNIYCISPNKINEAGRVNVMCFDKTGTLTEEGLDLLGVRPVFFDKNSRKLNFTKLVKDIGRLNLTNPHESLRASELQNYIEAEPPALSRSSVYKNTKLLPSEQMLEIMAVCHSLTTVDGKLIGDPLDLKMFESTRWVLEDNDQQKYDALVLAVVRPPTFEITGIILEEPEDGQGPEKKEIGIIRRFEFSSKLQRMSCVVKNLQETGFKVHIKGSPEKIRELCRPETVPSNFHHVLEKYTEDGYRVLACATKATNMNYRKIMASNREDIEKDFTFIGFLIMENRLKPITTEIIDLLQSAEIRTIMVTGDNALTAISVARQCHIVGQNQRIFLGDIAEKKVNRKDVIHWKDFEYSERALNNELEPDASMIESRVLRSPSRTSSKGLHDSQSRGPRAYANSYMDSPKLQSAENSRGRSSLQQIPRHSSEHERISVRPRNESSVIRKGLLASSANIADLEVPFFNMQGSENYCLAITGKAFSLVLHEAEVNQDPQYQKILSKLLRRCLIFARMHPDEKALMIKHMMSVNKNIVGMCGDGANDVGALKTANLGVSLSEAEASIAAPFTSNIQDISCIPILLREGKSALSTSYQAFKYMALYSIIQFTSVTILYLYQIDLTNWSYYHIDIMIILPLSATMAMSGTYRHLTKYKPTGRLVSVQILTSVIGQGVIQIIFQVLGIYMLFTSSFYAPICVDNFDTNNACYENTTIYIITIWQYCLTALVFMVGKPFREPFYTNFWFTGFFIILIVLNVFATFNPFNWQFVYDQDQWAGEWYLPLPYRIRLMILIAINSLLTIIWERVVVKSVSVAWKGRRDEKKRLREAAESLYVPPSLGHGINTSS